ncbi:isochorismatase family protein [Paraburkholderia sediminicola]|uniref:isochorismatase family protein n=1 Tax=Paraburkholderia sediminicola TaxID=458836 RepID=UPI0038B7EEB3
MSLLCDASRAMLIIIDLQKKLMPVISEGNEIVKRALFLAQMAKLLDVPIVGTEQQPLRLGGTVPEIGQMFSRRFEKDHFDATAEPGFADCLEPGRDDLIVLGCEAHVCVLQTVLGLRERNRRVRLVVDAIGSRQSANKIVAIDRAKSAGAELVTSEMVAFEWLRTSEHPRFREALKLIK